MQMALANCELSAQAGWRATSASLVAERIIGNNVVSGCTYRLASHLLLSQPVLEQTSPNI